ncbi:hypothetical protein [Ensifer canadensis]
MMQGLRPLGRGGALGCRQSGQENQDRTVYPATNGVPPAFVARIGCKCPEIELDIVFGILATDLCDSSDAGDSGVGRAESQ